MIELTTEQEFSIASYRIAVAEMTEAQAKSELVSLYRLMLIKEASYKDLIAKEWGLK
jgi:hypothetical protein